MRVEDALSQLQTIQTQLARTQQCWCYRWATVGASGLFAALATAVQTVQVPHPTLDLKHYLTLWIGVAAVSVALIAAEIVVEWKHRQSRHFGRQTLAAVSQFAPCVLVGALVTWAIATTCPEHATLLPGLWAIFFSLGIFASVHYLPSGGLVVATYYLLTGLVCIVGGRGDQALQPWSMFITFAVGQMLAAVVLYDGREQDGEDGYA
jgi:hypothetical protein